MSGLVHPASLPQTRPLTTPIEPADTSATPGRSSRVAGPLLSVSRTAEKRAATAIASTARLRDPVGRPTACRTPWRSGSCGAYAKSAWTTSCRSVGDADFGVQPRTSQPHGTGGVSSPGAGAARGAKRACPELGGYNGYHKLGWTARLRVDQPSRRIRAIQAGLVEPFNGHRHGQSECRSTRGADACEDDYRFCGQRPAGE